MTDTKRPGSIAVLVTRDPMFITPKQIAPWELPLLQAKWPGGTEVGAFTPGVKGEMPDADAEYARLEKVYGIDSDTKIPYVAEVYGRGEAGIDKLAEAIEGSWEPPKPRASKRLKAEIEASKPAPIDPAKGK